MSQVIYPDGGKADAVWLQQSVQDYFAAMNWQPQTVTTAVAGDSRPSDRPAIAQAAELSLDMTVTQYFAAFACVGAPVTSLDPAQSNPTPAAMGNQTVALTDDLLDAAMVEDFLDFAPTADPDAELDAVGAEDVGSLADLSDFF